MDGWLVDGRKIPWDLAVLYADARQRILSSRKLRQHYEIAMDPKGQNLADHLAWLVRAKTEDIKKALEAFRQEQKIKSAEPNKINALGSGTGMTTSETVPEGLIRVSGLTG